jgi:hypothetical protein
LAACELDDPTASGQGGLISVDVVPASLLANGVARGAVEVVLREDTRDTVSVLFTTEAGSFVNAEAAQPKQIRVLAVGNRATAILQSGVETRLVTVRASAGGFTALDSLFFSPALPTRVVLTSNRRTAKADGATVVTITAELLTPAGEGTVSQNTRVALTAVDTTTGQEVPDLRREAGSDSVGRTTFNLVSAEPVSVWVRVSIPEAAGVTDSLLVRFTPP